MSEASEAKRDGSILQPNSGRGKFAKGDALLGEWCIDYKEYEKSFSITESNWGKVCTDAFACGNKEPTLKLILGSGQNKTRVFVISETMFHLMNDAYKEKYNE